MGISKRAGLNPDIFIPKVNQEIMQVHRDYLDRPEKREVKMEEGKMIARTASIMNQFVGYEK